MFLKQLSSSEKEAFIYLAYHIATTDNNFADEEKQILEEYAKEMEISFNDIPFGESRNEDTLIKSFRDSRDDIVKKVFIELMGLALVDKVYNEREEEILQKYIIEYDLGEEYFLSVKKWVEKMNNLYQDLSELI